MGEKRLAQPSIGFNVRTSPCHPQVPQPASSSQSHYGGTMWLSVHVSMDALACWT